MSTTQILSRIELVLMERLGSDASMFFSVERDTFWVRTVVKPGHHVEGEGKSLIEAFQNFLSNIAEPPEATQPLKVKG